MTPVAFPAIFALTTDVSGPVGTTFQVLSMFLKKPGIFSASTENEKVLLDSSQRVNRSSVSPNPGTWQTRPPPTASVSTLSRAFEWATLRAQLLISGNSPDRISQTRFALVSDAMAQIALPDYERSVVRLWSRGSRTVRGGEPEGRRAT
jgi:hypothetical protein